MKNSSKFEDVFNQAEKLRGAGKYRLALRKYERAIQIIPKNVSCMTGKGICFYFLDKDKEATIWFNKALKIDPQNIKALEYMGHALQELKKHSKAIGYFKKAFSIDDGDAHYAYEIGLSFYLLDKNKESIIWFDKALRIDPTDAESMHYKGHVLSQSGNHKKAIEYFKKALSLEQNPYLLTDLGIASYYLGKYKEATNYLNRALNKNSKDDDALCYKGLLLEKRGEYKKAMKLFNKSIKYDDNVDALEAKGHLLWLEGNISEAIKYFTKLKKSKKNSVKHKNDKFANEAQDIEFLISQHENKKVELKSSLSYPHNLQGKDVDEQVWKSHQRKVEEELLETIVAFLNTEGGGTIIVGVSNEKVILGLDKDFEILGITKHGDDKEIHFDKWKLHLENLIKSNIGPQLFDYITIEPKIHREKLLAKVTLKHSSEFQFLKTDKGDIFVYRKNSGNQRLNTREFYAYLQNKKNILPSTLKRK